MGTTLTGTTPQDTYDSLIKVTDNGPLSATAKYLSDGLGNDSALAVSTSVVGIGTASPAAPLHTVGTVEANGSLYRGIFGGSSVQDADMTGLSGGNGSELQLQSPSTTRGSYLTIGGGLANGEALGGIAFYNSNNTDGKRLRSYLLAAQEGATANEQGGYLSFGTAADAATTPSERMRITSAGNVGIGTNNPSNFDGLGFASPILDLITSLNVRGRAADGVAIFNMGGETYRKAALFTPIQSSDPYLGFAVGSSGTSSNAPERMRITSTGNVGIGTSSPATTLEILGANEGEYLRLGAGTISARSLTFSSISNSGFSGVAHRINVQNSFGFLAMAVAGSDKVTVTSNGLTFNGDTAAANALDDYEEGTFTATITPSTSGTITSGASFNTWSYTKIGRQVTINGAFVISSVSSPVGAQLRIGGFPFTIANSLSAYGAASSMYADASASYAKTSPPTWHVVNTTELLIEYDASTVAASDEIYVTATYFV